MAGVNINIGRRMGYHTMIVLVIIAGAFSIAVLFMRDGEIISFILSLVALGGLIGGSNTYDERERRKLNQSYRTPFEWLLLAIMLAYAIIVTSRWLNVIEGVALFLNSHWPVLTLSLMCLFLGMAGFQKIRNENSA